MLYYKTTLSTLFWNVTTVVVVDVKNETKESRKYDTIQMNLNAFVHVKNIRKSFEQPCCSKMFLG